MRPGAAASTLAWCCGALYAALCLAAAALVAGGDGRLEHLVSPLAVGYAVVGTLVAAREPRNVVGWLMLVIANAFALQALTDVYLRYPGQVLQTEVAWVGGWILSFWMMPATLALPLLFPDGRLLSPRWRPAAWLGVGALLCTVTGSAFSPGRLDVDAPVPIRNPLGLSGELGRLVDWVGVAGDVLFGLAIVLGIVSLVVRLRGSHARARQQVTWFAYAGALAVVSLLMALTEVFASQVVPGDTPTWTRLIGVVGWSGALLMIFLGIPVAVGIAILRHRLYDIDVVVNRTLVYLGLTAVLVATYLTGVLVLRLALDPFTGSSDLAVAASTLGVAALFRPARARMQAAVDRRFFRSRYDAAHTLSAFTGTLRHVVDLDALDRELRSVVTTTMQPTEVSLWLRRR